MTSDPTLLSLTITTLRIPQLDSCQKKKTKHFKGYSNVEMGIPRTKFRLPSHMYFVVAQMRGAFNKFPDFLYRYLKLS